MTEDKLIRVETKGLEIEEAPVLLLTFWDCTPVDFSCKDAKTEESYCNICTVRGWNPTTLHAYLHPSHICIVFELPSLNHHKTGLFTLHTLRLFL
jgi:hypothetical protein